MANRGRPRKTTKQLKLHGTFRKDRRFEGEPEPDTDIPERPKWLKGEAKKEWNRMTPLLAKMKCVTCWDRSMLALYCHWWGVYVMLARKIKKADDVVVFTTNGNEVQNPLFTAMNRASKNCKEAAMEFGLSPVARTRLNVEKKEHENAFMAILNRKA
jgi:P27 family predicted phage terminase small subunit